MMKRLFRILTILYVMGTMIFIWAIDVSIGAIWRGNILTNGWQRFDPLQIYHVGLFGIIIITFLFVSIVIFMERKGVLVTKLRN